MSYRPNRHYWVIGGSTTEVYFSGTNTMVPVNDPAYSRWRGEGVPVNFNVERNIPTEIADISALKDVLMPLGFFPEWLMKADNFIQPAVGVYTKDQLKQYAANVRWIAETSGIEVSDQPIATDRGSQAMISGAYNYVVQNPSSTVNWKTEDGFVELNAAAITAIASAVGDHIQACFAKEAEVISAIVAGTVTTLEQVAAAFND